MKDYQAFAANFIALRMKGQSIAQCMLWSEMAVIQGELNDEIETDNNDDNSRVCSTGDADGRS